MTIEVTPSNTVSAEQLSAMVESACRAPSLHNSQPWRFRWGKTFEVYFRQPTGEHELLPAEHPATQLALGAVIENLSTSGLRLCQSDGSSTPTPAPAAAR